MKLKAPVAPSVIGYLNPRPIAIAVAALFGTRSYRLPLNSRDIAWGIKPDPERKT